MNRPLMLLLVTMMSCTPLFGARDARSLLEQADASYAEGVERFSTDRAASIDAFARSASLSKLVATEMGARRAPAALMYNIGNAALLSGEAGEAVLWYKRAERLAPNDSDVRTNLAAAREKVGSTASVRPKDSVLDQLTIIEFAPPAARFWTAAAGLTAMWTLALWRLFGATRRPSRLGVAACGVIGVLAGASLAPRELRLREPTEAVVLRETTGRAGPDEGTYEPKPASPLKAGTEVRVVEERGSWTLVELGDGTRSWVLGKAVERVAG